MNATKPGMTAKSSLSDRLLSVLLFLFIGFLAADLIVLFLRTTMLPTQAPPARPKRPPVASSPGPGAYSSVVTRNMFSSDGTIPEPLIAKQDPNKRREELPPIPSQLPLNLVGTLVHSNPEKSLAAIEMKGKNQILSFRVKQDIEGLATMEKIERMKVIFRNLNSGRLEYLEMKTGAKMTLKTTARPGAGSSDVKKVSDTEFEIKRSDLLKYTSDLSSILMQARVAPARRGGSGEIYGFRVMEMQPGSIYSQLGLQVQDVLTGVNGTPVTSAQQAMEMYNTLRNSDSIEISVERGGQNQKLKYKIAP